MMTDRTVAELEAAVNSARVNNDAAGEVQALRRLGIALQRNRKLTQAATCLSQAKKLVDESGDTAQKAMIYATLGCIYWEMAQLKKAMTWLEKARALAQQTQDRRAEAIVFTLIGMAHWRKCQWQAGLTCFQEVLEIRGSLKEAGGFSEDENYVPLQEALERGVMTLENRIRLGRAQNDPLKILQPMFSLIPLYLFTGRKSAAETLLQEVTPLAEQLRKLDILEAIPKLQTLSGNFNSLIEEK